MKPLKVIAGIADVQGRDVLVITIPGSKELLTTVDWDFKELQPKGYTEACQMAGNVVLRLLYLEHKELFNRYPGMVPPPPPFTDPQGMVLELVKLSGRHRTKAYVSAIEDLLKRYEKEFAGTDIVANWESIKPGIVRYAD